MACCTEYQTECLRVVTIGYLKSFVGSEIHSSANDSPMSISHSNGDTYCPTYAELTGGSLVQNFKSDSDPQGYVDGIIVSGSYASNQLVRQQDLSLKYTRFSEITISASKTTLSECGDSTSLSYTYKFNVTTKGMNSSCSVTSSTSSESSSRTSYSLNGDGAFSLAGSTVSVPKNDDGGNPRRTVPARSTTAKVTGSWRGSSPSASVKITQSALGGDWIKKGDVYTGLDFAMSCGGAITCEISGPSEIDCSGGTANFSVSKNGSTSCSFDCNGGTASATAVGHGYEHWIWKDSCNTEYDREPFNDKPFSENLGTSSETFSYRSCCSGDYSRSKTFSVNYHGFSKNGTASQTCNGCCCSDCNAPVGGGTYDECDDQYYSTSTGTVTIGFTSGANSGNTSASVTSDGGGKISDVKITSSGLSFKLNSTSGHAYIKLTYSGSSSSICS